MTAEPSAGINSAVLPTFAKKFSSLATALLVAGPLLVSSQLGDPAPARASAAQVGAAATSTSYVYEREFIYSTEAIEQPRATTVDRSGRVYVAGNDWTPGAIDTRVRVFSAKGKLVDTWADIPISTVGGMDVGPDGNIYVTDFSGDTAADIPASIKVYRPNGRFVRSYGLSDNGWTAGGIVVAANGTSYVTDPVNDAIHKFAPNGTYQISFGGNGTAPGRYDGPWDVDLAPNGDLVVADTGNYRVQVVRSTNGAPVRRWGQPGLGNGQFSGGVLSVEVHAKHVYVVDWTSRVQVFTLPGRFARTIKPTTRRKGELVSNISEVVFGPGNVMYVAGVLYPFENGVAKYRPARGKIKVKGAKLKADKARKAAKIQARCKGTAPCSGKIKLTKGGKSFGKGTYKIARSKSGKLKVKLNRLARKALRSHRKVKVKITVTPTMGTVLRKKVRLTR